VGRLLGKMEKQPRLDESENPAGLRRTKAQVNIFAHIDELVI
jgi:hypothetical protein